MDLNLKLLFKCKLSVFLRRSNLESFRLMRSFCSNAETVCERSQVGVGRPELNGTDGAEFFSVSHAKQAFLKRGIVFNDGFTCLSVECTLCSREDKGHIFINKVSGFFLCDKCQHCGPWKNLEPFIYQPRAVQKHFKLTQNPSFQVGTSRWSRLSQHLQDVNKLSTEQFETVLEESSFKNIAHDVLCKVNAHVDSRNQDLYFPLIASNDGVCGFKVLLQSLEEETFPSSAACGVLKCSAEENSSSAILVASIADFLVLTAQNFEDYDIVCLPHGQFSLPQSVLPLLESYNKLVIWFGGEPTSWDNSRLFARKLFVNRCHLVRPINEVSSPLGALKAHLNLKDIVNEAKCVAHSSIVTFADLRDDVVSELYNSDQAAGVKWVRFPQLNAILKGHRRGELTILTGPTGSGKTTFISEYSLDLAVQKVTTLWGSFEIRNQRLARMMLQQMVRLPLDNNLDKFDEWADKFEQLPMFFMTFHGQQDLSTVMDAVQHASYVYDVAHVIIDNVQFMLGLSANESGFIDRFYRQDALIAAFRNFATTSNCHVTLVIHPRKEKEGELLSASSIFGGAKASQEADNVLIIQHSKNPNSLKTRKFLQVAKNRFSGDLGMLPLEFDRDALSFRSKK